MQHIQWQALEQHLVWRELECSEGAHTWLASKGFLLIAQHVSNCEGNVQHVSDRVNLSVTSVFTFCGECANLYHVQVWYTLNAMYLSYCSFHGGSVTMHIYLENIRRGLDGRLLKPCTR